MISNSIIKQTAMASPVRQASLLAPKGGKSIHELATPLMLTSLVDAFSILVVYLLMNFSTTGELLYVSKDMVLPQAIEATELQRDTIVKVENEKYYIEQEEVTEQSLVAKLLERREVFQKERPGQEFPGVIIVQADKRTPYKLLNSIVLAGAHTGYSEIKFAVINLGK